MRPMKRGSVSAKTAYYDVGTGEVKFAKDKADVDELYEVGGTYAELSEPVKVGDEWVNIVRVDGSADSSYLRAMKPNERVLNYRDGYYPVVYDANFFVQKKMRNADGEEFTKTIGSAKTREEADKLVSMLKADDPDADVFHVPDRRNELERSSTFDEMGWSLNVSSGLSAQRVRGERLIDAAANLEKAGNTNLLDPLEAVSQQISQLSRRVSMRGYLDTTKQRWIDNYAEKLGMETDRGGNYKFPSSVDQIKRTSGADPQDVADARTMFNYIYSLENGYINTIDTFFKAAFEFGAEALSNMGFTKGEAALRDWG